MNCPTHPQNVLGLPLLLTTLLILIPLVPHLAQTQEVSFKPGYIYTVAGYGVGGSNFGSAVNLYRPTGLAIGPRSYIFICDTGANIVYQMDPWNIVDPLIGDGIPGFEGDGGPRDIARVHSPTAVATDGTGKIYIADAGNHRIRLVDLRNDVVQTIAGNGRPSAGEENVPALQAGLTWPAGLALDIKGNLYIADAGDHRIRKLSPDGFLTTYAGTGSPGFSGDEGPAQQAQLNTPTALLADTEGGLYVVDQGNQRIRYITPQGTIRTVLGGGKEDPQGVPPLQVRLREPRGIAFPEKGKLLITDGSRVLIWDEKDQVSVLMGNDLPGFAVDEGPAKEAKFRDPWGIVFEQAFRRIIVADRLNGMIRSLEGKDFLRTVVGGQLGDGGAATDAKVTEPRNVLFKGGGTFLIADTGNHRVRRVLRDGSIQTVAGNGDLLLVDTTKALECGLGEPEGLALSPDGNWFITDRELNVIWRVTPEGMIHRIAGTGQPGFAPPGILAREASLKEPCGLAYDSQGNLYFTERGNHRVCRITREGKLEVIAGTGEPGIAKEGESLKTTRLKEPAGLALGPDGRLFVAEAGNHRIIALNLKEDRLTIVAGTGQAGQSPEGLQAQETSLNHPEGITVDGAGNLFISDTLNHRVLRVNPEGRVKILAGTGQPGFTGDEGPAQSASLYEPRGLALDSEGNLLVADTLNHRIRLIAQVAEVKPTYITGDLNGDGKVDLRDVLLAMRIAVGLVKPSPLQTLAGDVAPVQVFADARRVGDGRITLLDVIRLLRRVAGLEKQQWP